MKYHSYGQFDTPPKRLGDTRFVGVNSRLDPHTLQPGYCAEAVNLRFIRGTPETRLGTMVLPWANKVSASDVQPWGTIYGVGVFNDPQTFQDYLIIAADGNVYFCQPHNVPQVMTLPTGVTITENVTFTQAFNVLLMHRGFATRHLQLTGIYNSWEFISQSQDAIDAGTFEIPNTERAIFFQNRLFLPKQNDEIAVSDFNDYTSYQPVAQELKINQGSSDRIVNVTKFNDVTLIIFKDRSVYALTNVYGSLTNATLDLLNDQFGLVAKKSVAHCGSDLLFLSEHGVMSIRQTEQNKLQSVLIPLSDPIQPVIDRINWQYAENSVAAYWDNKYYLAVPLDEAEQLGHELITDQMTYSGGGDTITVRNIVTGATYRWEKTASDTSLTNGTQTLTNSADFTAQGTTVTLTGATEGTIDGTLKRVHKGVNNAILVYDFLNQAWAGYDEGDGLVVKEMFLFPYNGQRRLFISTHEGYVKLYEEDYEDQLSAPTATLSIVSRPDVSGDTLRINDGDVITIDSGVPTNSGTTWGTSTFAAAQANICFNTSKGTRSYSPLCTTPWDAGDAQAFRESLGVVKFISTNGVVPVVTTSIVTVLSITRSGTTVTVTTDTSHDVELDDHIYITGSDVTAYNGKHICTENTSDTTFKFLIDGSPANTSALGIKVGVELHSTNTEWATLEEVQQQPIETTFVSRAYSDEGGDLSAYQWISCDVQTWHPSYSISVITPGAEESFSQAADQTKDRRHWYRPFDKPAFSVDNADGRFMDKWRKDYSVKFGEDDGETDSIRVDTTSGGIRLDLHQDSRETFHINRDARSLQVKITNASGRIRIMQTLLEAAKQVTPGFVHA